MKKLSGLEIMSLPKIRRKVKNLRKGMQRLSVQLGYNPEDLTGACSATSYAFAKMMWKLGYRAYIMDGEYDGYGHTWCRLNGYVVDLTATQFGVKEPILVKPAKEVSEVFRGERGTLRHCVGLSEKKLLNELVLEVLK